jgi:hypothetical protein
MKKIGSRSSSCTTGQTAANKTALAPSVAQKEADRAELLLAAAKVDLRGTVDALPTLHWRCLPDGSAEFLNQTWLEYTG